jgi:RsiW-degrading membrane proteinase PrsW (M82 family)
VPLWFYSSISLAFVFTLLLFLPAGCRHLRRSHGVQRQQLKWFTYAGALIFLWLVVGDYLLPNLAIIGALSGLIYALVPVATGAAILRYRLYDIDRLIYRTPV